MVWLYSVVLVSNMVGVKNKWNDMVECGGIVAASEQWLRLVMYEGRRTEAQKDIVVVVILSGVTLDAFELLVFIRRGFWGWELMLGVPITYQFILYLKIVF